MQLLVEILVYGTVVPAAVALAICGVARRSARHAQQFRAAGAFSVALAFFATWIALPWTPFAIERAWHWLPRVGILAAGIGMFADGVPRPVRVGLRIAVAALTAHALLPSYPEFADAWFTWVLVVAASIVLAWSVLERAAEVSDPRGLAIVLGIWVLSSAALLERCGIMKFAQLAGVVAVSAGPVLLLLRRRPALAGAVAPLAVLIPGLVLSGRFETFADVPEWSFGCILLVPLSVLVTPRWWTPAAAAATLAAIGVGSAALATI